MAKVIIQLNQVQKLFTPTFLLPTPSILDLGLWILDYLITNNKSQILLNLDLLQSKI